MAPASPWQRNPLFPFLPNSHPPRGSPPLRGGAVAQRHLLPAKDPTKDIFVEKETEMSSNQSNVTQKNIHVNVATLYMQTYIPAREKSAHKPF